MKDNLTIHRTHFISYKDDQFSIDVLGGIDLQSIQRMICTVRLSHQDYPPLRSTLDLYNDQQIDKLLRTICDNWQVKLLDYSKSIHRLIHQLENSVSIN